MRLYKRATELQAARISSLQHILAEIPEKARLVAELRADPSFESKNERIIQMSTAKQFVCLVPSFL